MLTLLNTTALKNVLVEPTSITGPQFNILLSMFTMFWMLLASLGIVLLISQRDAKYQKLCFLIRLEKPVVAQFLLEWNYIGEK